VLLVQNRMIGMLPRSRRHSSFATPNRRVDDLMRLLT
jgi:hypothetical protein